MPHYKITYRPDGSSPNRFENVEADYCLLDDGWLEFHVGDKLNAGTTFPVLNVAAIAVQSIRRTSDEAVRPVKLAEITDAELVSEYERRLQNASYAVKSARINSHVTAPERTAAEEIQRRLRAVGRC